MRDRTAVRSLTQSGQELAREDGERSERDRADFIQRKRLRRRRKAFSATYRRQRVRLADAATGESGLGLRVLRVATSECRMVGKSCGPRQPRRCTDPCNTLTLLVVAAIKEARNPSGRGE
jgi:hypothetical protein